LFAAMVLHLALPVAAAVAPEPVWRKLGVRGAPKVAEIDVDISNIPSDHPPEARDDTSVGDGRLALNEQRPNNAGRPQFAPRAEQHDPEQVATGADDSPDSFSQPEPGKKDDPFSKPPSMYEVPGLGSPGALGGGPLPLGVLPPDGTGPMPAPTKTSKRTFDKDAANKSIDRAIRQKDSQLGLDFPAAASIAAVLRDAVRASDAPFECKGSFSVAVSEAGKVTAVRLGGYSGGDSGTWNAISKSALATLSSRVFEMKSSFAKGAMVGVTIKSEQKMPGGGVGRQGATFSFDVADVGAKPIRVVTMSFSARPVE
jgi:hypothetical protein